ncbi:MAG: methyltransferase domain-containing protein [Anaerolineae bacterium]|nr:methyltransferase domain-containing protein [Anaerolineae bacterium]
MPDPTHDYLPLLLNQYWFAPPVGLWRAIELRILATESFARPVLDLGCGDGLITQVLFEGEPPIEMGFDPWLSQVRKAPATGAYNAVQQAQGAAMPYRDSYFGTVLSNSVVEHIPDLEPVLLEAARVLRPEGRLILTVPSDAFRRLLAGYRDRVAVADLEGAEAYASEIDAWLEHHRYPSPEAWKMMLASAGLALVRARYYVVPQAVAVWDRANTAFGVRETGRPALFRWAASPRLRRLGYQRWIRQWVVRRLSRRWRGVYEMDVPEGGVGGGLLVVGEKP